MSYNLLGHYGENVGHASIKWVIFVASRLRQSHGRETNVLLFRRRPQLR